MDDMLKLIEWKIALGSMIHLAVLVLVVVWIAGRLSRQLSRVEKKQDDLLSHLREKNGGV